MPLRTIIKNGVRGVDGKSDPLTLGTKYMAHAVNMAFKDGRMFTRPGIDFQPLNLKGKFGGASLFVPSLGISFRPFAPCGARMATAVGGKIYVNNAPNTGVICRPMLLKGPEETCSRSVDDECSTDIHIYTAENLLVVQSLNRNTMWWTGEGDLTVSIGMASERDQVDGAHSHDTFQTENNRNFLINGAGLGIFWNGRIHQQGPHAIFVGDLIHKRGAMGTTDIVLMEEQALPVCGDPLSTNSKMGSLVAIEGLPQMGTPNGEGELIGFYEGGIVSYDTWQFPRKSTFTGDGKRIDAGWDTKQMVKHRCNKITAVGRYAVAQLERDLLFRSGFGLHILSTVLGVEFTNSETVNIVSPQVSHILDLDDESYLHGSAVGYWMRENRWFATTGMTYNAKRSTSPAGRGFVSMNKTWKLTEEGTPLTAWEGVWVIDSGMYGIHRFTHTGMREDKGSYGFLCSDSCGSIFYGCLHNGTVDSRDEKDIPIPWAVETGRFDFGDPQKFKELSDGRFEGKFPCAKTMLKVFVRTDKQPHWKLWRKFIACDRKLKCNEMAVVNKDLGEPEEEYKEGTWFQFRIEGSGAGEVIAFEVEVSEGSTKMEEPNCYVVQNCTNIHPLATSCENQSQS